MHQVRSPRRGPLAALLLLAFLWALADVPVRAQQVSLAKEAYLTPPKEIADAVLASRNENVTLTNLSPDGRKFLLTKGDGMPTLARLARPSVYLGEMAFDHTAHRARQLWVQSKAGYNLFFHADKRTVPVQAPDGARVSNAAWSPDGSKLAFFAHFDDATHIYIADAETGYSRRLTTTPVLATLVTTFQWSKDGQKIQTILLPDDGKRELPKRNGAPAEPRVRVARDGPNPSRTYRYLLESPHDMKLLEHLATGQLALIDIHDGKVVKVGFPAMLRSVSMAPGEGQFRVSTMKKPFSYYVPVTRFGSTEGIWNLEGKPLHTLADRALQENEPTPAAVAATTTPTGKGKAGGPGRGGPGKAAPGKPPVVVQQPDPPVPTDPTQPQPDPGPDNPFRPTQPADPNAKRDLGWRPDGVGMSYLQLEPEKADDKAKDAKAPAKDEKAAARKDRVYQWLPPFGKDDVKVVYETPHRISSLQYSEDCQLLFLTQTVDGRRQISAVDLADPKTTYVIHRSTTQGEANTEPPADAPKPPGDEDTFSPLGAEGWGEGDDEQQRRGPPGAGSGPGFGAGAGGPGLMMRPGRGSVSVVRMTNTGDVYVSSTDRPRGDAKADAKGFPRPTLDRVNVKTGKKDRIFEGKGELLETIDAVDGDEVKLVFTTRQKQDVVPDSYVFDLQSGKETKLTNNVNHAPWFQQLKVERFQVTRADGFKFWVKVTTPPKHEGKLPALFWIYPREYADQAAYNASAGRSAAAGNRFTAPAPRSMTLLTLLGYAVVEPDVPIVGPAGRMNDNYIPDLRNSLWAAIDALDKKGVIDRDRLAVGGHSYGAFSTANAMAHTPFFKAGIAGDGNYNRTLTPMTFQTERRQIWDARETYLEMSPLLWANRVHGALLMYHGMDDANTGTHPINAEFLFMALDGLGKPAALYMYPYEGHGPVALETTLDLWARWTAWLDTYVKNPGKEKK